MAVFTQGGGRSLGGIVLNILNGHGFSLNKLESMPVTEAETIVGRKRFIGGCGHRIGPNAAICDRKLFRASPTLGFLPGLYFTTGDRACSGGPATVAGWAHEG